MATPHTQENTIRVHDEAFYNWLGGFHADYGLISGTSRPNFPLLRVFASPHRAFAATSDLLISQGWIDASSPELQKARADHDWSVLPLPVASIERDDPIVSNELAMVPAVIREYATGSNSREGYVDHPYPLYYITQFRVNFWCDKKFTHAAFFEWLMSQMGHRGSMQAEIMIPVVHDAPWGTQYQALHYTGSAGLSDLEGYDARHIRSLLSFSLHTWMFRKPANKDNPTPPIYSIIHDYDTESDLETYPGTGVHVTANLFPQRGFAYPVTGDATVTADELSVQATVEAPADAAYVCSLLTTPDTAGRSIWSSAFSYVADAAFDLAVRQQTDTANPDGTVTVVETPAHTFSVPASPDLAHAFHRFSVVTAPKFNLAIVGAGSPASVTLTNIDIRQVADKPRIVPTDIHNTVTDRTFIWRGLERRPYLVLGVARDTVVVGAYTAQVADDETSPDIVRTEDQDTDIGRGFCILIMPKADSVTLTVPASVTLLVASAQPFDGPYSGSTV